MHGVKACEDGSRARAWGGSGTARGAAQGPGVVRLKGPGVVRLKGPGVVGASRGQRVVPLRARAWGEPVAAIGPPFMQRAHERTKLGPRAACGSA